MSTPWNAPYKAEQRDLARRARLVRVMWSSQHQGTYNVGNNARKKAQRAARRMTAI